MLKEDRFLIVVAGYCGPVVFAHSSMRSMFAVLVSWMQGSCADDETSTAWEKKGGAWVPMFPYQHKTPEQQARDLKRETDYPEGVPF
jgi:hypothetical protein